MRPTRASVAHETPSKNEEGEEESGELWPKSRKTKLPRLSKLLSKLSFFFLSFFVSFWGRTCGICRFPG